MRSILFSQNVTNKGVVVLEAARECILDWINKWILLITPQKWKYFLKIIKPKHVRGLFLIFSI